MLIRSLSIVFARQALPLTSLVILASGCSGSSFSFGYHARPPVRVRHVHVHEDHVCHHGCHHHYWDGHRVVVLKGHRHGPGCGHYWDGEYWVVERKARTKLVHPRKPKVVKTRHVHSASCGCVFDRRGHKWVKVSEGHVHGPHCGHIRIEGRWTIRH
jgi:hypothetical protein